MYIVVRARELWRNMRPSSPLCRGVRGISNQLSNMIIEFNAANGVVEVSKTRLSIKKIAIILESRGGYAIPKDGQKS